MNNAELRARVAELEARERSAYLELAERSATIADLRAALRARGAGAVPEGYSVVPTLILNRMKRAVDDAEKMATEGMHLSGAKVSVEISDIKSMLLAASNQPENNRGT